MPYVLASKLTILFECSYLYSKHGFVEPKFLVEVTMFWLMIIARITVVCQQQIEESHDGYLLVEK